MSKTGTANSGTEPKQKEEKEVPPNSAARKTKINEEDKLLKESNIVMNKY